MNALSLNDILPIRMFIFGVLFYILEEICYTV